MPYLTLYSKTNADVDINIKLPKSVLKREAIVSGIKYNTNHNNSKIVRKPMSFVLFSSFTMFFIFLFNNFILIYYYIIKYNQYNSKI